MELSEPDSQKTTLDDASSEGRNISEESSESLTLPLEADPKTGSVPQKYKSVSEKLDAIIVLLTKFDKLLQPEHLVSRLAEAKEEAQQLKKFECELEKELKAKVEVEVRRRYGFDRHFFRKEVVGKLGVNLVAAGLIGYWLAVKSSQGATLVILVGLTFVALAVVDRITSGSR